jgi:hypothetical protein
MHIPLILVNGNPWPVLYLEPLLGMPIGPQWTHNGHVNGSNGRR